jgi:hypothetical protein
MSYDNPSHRTVLDAEGLRRWEPPHLDGYDSLRQAAAQQGFFNRPMPKLTGASNEFRLEPDSPSPRVTRN